MAERPILLVEDNPDDQLLSLRALHKCGIDAVTLAKDGVEACDIIFGKGRPQGCGMLPAMILLDLKLPRLDGLELLARLRADRRTSAIPVIIASSSRDPIDLQRCRDLGVTAYLNKPLTVVDLGQLLQELGFLRETQA